MIAFDTCHEYRRPSEDDPHAAQPIPDTRELMGLTEKGHKHSDSIESAKEQETAGIRDLDVEMTELEGAERRCSECGAVSIGQENAVQCVTDSFATLIDQDAKLMTTFSSCLKDCRQRSKGGMMTYSRLTLPVTSVSPSIGRGRSVIVEPGLWEAILLDREALAINRTKQLPFSTERMGRWSNAHHAYIWFI